MSSQKRREQRRRNRNKYAEEKLAAERLKALEPTETVLFEIAFKMSKKTVDEIRTRAFGLGDEEGEEFILETLFNAIKHRSLKDCEVTGWGFKEENEQ